MELGQVLRCLIAIEELVNFETELQTQIGTTWIFERFQHFCELQGLDSNQTLLPPKFKARFTLTYTC